jgi:hypothetical protein
MGASVKELRTTMVVASTAPQAPQSGQGCFCEVGFKGLPAIGVFFEFFLGLGIALPLDGAADAFVGANVIVNPARFLGRINFVLAGLYFDCFVSCMVHAASPGEA